jgi:predicted Zn-dependent protease
VLRFIQAGLAAALVLIVGGQVAAGGLKSLTTPQELALGQTFAEAVDRQFPLLRDPILRWYANLRGRQFADRSPRNDIPYFFRVINSPEINAFAIPGGHVYLNLGLLQVAEHEAEMLGIVGHEIGHVVARHGAKQIVRQQWASIAFSAGLRAYPNYYAYLAGNLFGQLGFLKMSRDAEREADEIGFQIMLSSGYDPTYMVSMFQKLKERYKRDPGRLQKLFLTHPPTDERIANLQALLAETALPEGLRSGSQEFDEIKIRVTELYPAPEPDAPPLQLADEEDPSEPTETEEDEPQSVGHE